MPLQFQPIIPQNAQDFEELCAHVWSLNWSDPGAGPHGRSGLKQHGVDIVYRPNGMDPPHGVQCKLFDRNHGGKLTMSIIRKEAALADAFVPPIASLTIATTQPATIDLDQELHDLNVARAKGGKFHVRIAWWDTIKSYINRHAELRERYSGGSPLTPAMVEQFDLVKALIDEKLGGASTSSIQQSSALMAVGDENAWASDAQFPALAAQIKSARKILNKGQVSNASELIEDVASEIVDSDDEELIARLQSIRGLILAVQGEPELALAKHEEAAALCPDEIRFTENRAFALLNADRPLDALALVESQLGAHPNSWRLHRHRVVAWETLREIVVPEEHSPSHLHDRLAHAFSAYYGAMGDVTKALKWAERAHKQDPDEPEYQHFLAVALIRSVNASHFFATPEPWSLDQRATLDRARDLLVDAWAKVARHEMRGQYEVMLTNLAVLERSLGYFEAFNERLDTDIPGSYLDLMRAVRAFQNDDFDGALRLLDQISGAAEPDPRPLRIAVLKAMKRPDDAISTASGFFEAALAEPEATPAGWALLEYVPLLLANDRVEDASAVMERYRERAGEDIDFCIASGMILKHTGRVQQIQEVLDRAEALIPPDDPRASRRALFWYAMDLGGFDIIRRLAPLVFDFGQDHPAIRQVFINLVEAKAFDTGLALLELLSPALQATGFFELIRARLLLHLHENDRSIDAYQRSIKAYRAAGEPIPFTVEYVNTLAYAGKQPAVVSRAIVDLGISADTLNTPREYQIFANVMSAIGCGNEAMDIRYRALRRWPDQQPVHDLLLVSALGSSTFQPHQPKRVAANIAVTIEDPAADSTQTFVIEPDPRLVDPPKYLAPDHPWAAAVMGAEVGTTVTLNPGEPGEREIRILTITDKITQVVRWAIAEYPSRFPGSRNFVSVPLLSPEDAHRMLEQLRRQLTQRSEQVEQWWQQRQRFSLPFGVLAKWFSIPATGLLYEETRRDEFNEIYPINSGMEHISKARAKALLEEIRQKHVLDPSTLIWAYGQDLAPALMEALAIPRVPQSVRDTVRAEIRHLEASGTLLGQTGLDADGKAVINEAPEGYKERALDMWRSFAAWLDKDCDLCPAAGLGIPERAKKHPDWQVLWPLLDEDTQMLLRSLPPDDTGIVITEDRALRYQLLKLNPVQVGVSLQELLFYAYRADEITATTYADALLALMGSGARFVMVQSRHLIEVGKAEDWVMGGRLEQLLGALSLERTEPTSAGDVLGWVLLALWHQVPTERRTATAYRLIQRLLNHPNLRETWITVAVALIDRVLRSCISDEALTGVNRLTVNGLSSLIIYAINRREDDDPRPDIAERYQAELRLAQLRSEIVRLPRVIGSAMPLPMITELISIDQSWRLHVGG